MMSYTQQAIQLAIEKGGYKPAYGEDMVYLDSEPEDGLRYRKLVGTNLIPESRIFHDPLFWQALGKALGWEQSEGNGEYPVYRDKWHQFIDHIMSGKDAESWFKELLK